MEKNKYKNSKHFLLVAHPLEKPCLTCKDFCKRNVSEYFVPLNYFDTLNEIKRYITSKMFLKMCSDAKVYCLAQLKILVGIDSKLLGKSINTYIIKDYNKKLFTNHGYYFYIEQMIHLEEFVEPEVLETLDKNIKNYTVSKYWEKTYNDVKYL
jgi:hypothetical protein